MPTKKTRATIPIARQLAQSRQANEELNHQVHALTRRVTLLENERLNDLEPLPDVSYKTPEPPSMHGRVTDIGEDTPPALESMSHQHRLERLEAQATEQAAGLAATSKRVTQLEEVVG